MTLAEIAELIGARVHGDPSKVIEGLATLGSATSRHLSFFVNPRYLSELKSTRAGAVLIKADQLGDAPCDALICENPYLAFAMMTGHFVDVPTVTHAVHDSAIVDSTAVLAADVIVGARAVIGANVRVGEGTIIHPGAVIEANCSIGANCVIYANVTLYHGVVIGDRVTLHSGCVIGADGFGFAHSGDRWVKIHQLGGVVIGNDVEIGANTTVDRGALDDTRIGNQVIIDNQVQIAHNVVIGDGTAIAGCTGIAGSTTIGKHCTIAGGAAIAGHLTIADGVHITATTLVSKSLTEKNSYSSGTPLEKTSKWKKNAARFNQLDETVRRFNALEKKLAD
ncbi:MAG: UDP-3-O-(3-hydroxymyristoyl)glucosamine N-acyltransferase [Pseudomonadota bacterium]